MLVAGVASRVWEEVVLAVVGDAFQLGDEICGVVMTTKPSDDVLSIWTKNAQNRELNLRIRFANRM